MQVAETTKIGILGAGNMGRQLAILFASNNLPVILWNHQVQSSFQVEFGRLALIQSKLGLIEKERLAEIVGSIRYVTDLAEVAGCSLVLETVKENISIKKQVLDQLIQKSGTLKVIATNTSTLSVTELASFTNCPDRFIGLHFFNPPMTMKLVEVIQGEQTSEETLQMAMQIIGRLGKHPVVLPETPGFVVNRLLFPMINEAVFLLSEGVSDVKVIDGCMRMGVNHPMGPLELADMIGLDVCLSILETLMDETGDIKYRPAPLLKKYVRAGKLGKKTGCGFYSYKKN